MALRRTACATLIGTATLVAVAVGGAAVARRLPKGVDGVSYFFRMIERNPNHVDLWAEYPGTDATQPPAE